MTDLCNTFRNQASRVWHRTGDAAALKMRLNEETITEMALFEIALAQRNSRKFSVEVFTKAAEARNGADWELWLVKKGRGVGFRVQSKRLYLSGKYEMLFKRGVGQAQKLISSAATGNCAPLYCFYNHPNSAEKFNFPDSGCGHDYRGASRWGCALVDANQVLGLYEDNIQFLSPLSKPWHELVCCKRGESLPDAGLRLVRELRSGLEEKAMAPPAVELSDLPFHVVAMLANRQDRASYFALSDVDPPAYLSRRMPTLAERVSRSEALDFFPDGVAGIAVFTDERS